MKVLLVNGSPHKDGCTFRALQEVANTLEQEGIATENFWVGAKAVGGCMGCFKCEKRGSCIIEDGVNEFRQKAYEADGFVFGSPTHYGGMSGNLVGFMDRLFFSEFIGNANKAFYLKPAAAEVEQDGEGLFNMRVLGRYMAYFLKCKEAAQKLGVPLPHMEPPTFTNFVR